jgi:hypothetical protein
MLSNQTFWVAASNLECLKLMKSSSCWGWGWSRVGLHTASPPRSLGEQAKRTYQWQRWGQGLTPWTKWASSGAGGWAADWGAGPGAANSPGKATEGEFQAESVCDTCLGLSRTWKPGDPPARPRGRKPGPEKTRLTAPLSPPHIFCLPDGADYLNLHNYLLWQKREKYLKKSWDSQGIITVHQC